MKLVRVLRSPSAAERWRARAATAVPPHEQSPYEERANSLSHGLALVATLVGGPYLIVQASQRSDAAFITGASLFVAATVILYLASTLYHALPTGRAKAVFRIIDHASIFLLIAGTYTPFTLGVLRGAWGWALFGVVWGLALVGIVLKAVGKVNHPLFSTGVYLSMGWLIVVAVDPLLAKVPAAGLVWLLAGGLFYTAGVAFYATDSRLPFGHLIWHLFVMAGTTCHFAAVLGYAA